IKVTSQSGIGIAGATVIASGASTQNDITDETGTVTFRPVTAGTYRVRVEHEGHITFEKEVTVRANAVTNSSFALNTAPPPPPPPPPPAPVVGARGTPQSLSLTTLAEKSLDGKDAVKVVPIACTGNSASRLIVLRDALPSASYEDADEMLYLMAGEASISMSGKDQAMTPGWASIVPRGTNFSLVKKGRNPAVILSILSGRPCPEP
ncbi:MAG: carboxypeptidase regulatory-like domain-containing protein, partial [Acidobacteriaceae bacterium]|nr:carboxypeptidase regulatory-like domain-containing protein [Acidobacteriaceae bacterium]